MTTAQASVVTENGGKYLRQLCKHWSHKLVVEVEGDNGLVRFGQGLATMAARDGALAVSVTAEDTAEVERLCEVLERHIERFAFREAPLNWNWTVSAA